MDYRLSRKPFQKQAVCPGKGITGKQLYALGAQSIRHIRAGKLHFTCWTPKWIGNAGLFNSGLSSFWSFIPAYNASSVVLDIMLRPAETSNGTLIARWYDAAHPTADWQTLTTVSKGSQDPGVLTLFRYVMELPSYFVPGLELSLWFYCEDPTAIEAITCYDNVALTSTSDDAVYMDLNQFRRGQILTSEATQDLIETQQLAIENGRRDAFQFGTWDSIYKVVPTTTNTWVNMLDRFSTSISSATPGWSFRPSAGWGDEQLTEVIFTAPVYSDVACKFRLASSTDTSTEALINSGCVVNIEVSMPIYINNGLDYDAPSGWSIKIDPQIYVIG